MDEMVNEVVEETTPAEGAVEDISDAEFDAIWDDSDEPLFAEEAFEDEADQPAEEPVTEEIEPTEAEEPKAEDTDQWLELKHFDEVKKVNKEQAKELAQKGMDYDRIRGKLGEAEQTNSELKKYKDFLTEIQGDFETLDDLMNDTRARIMSDKDGITYEDALAKVKSANQPKEQKKDPEVDMNAVIQQIRKASYTEFAQAYPDVLPKDIPREVWQDMEKTNNLLASYIKYEAKKIKDENAVLKKNAENKSRSTGSMKSSGNASYEKSEFDRVFEEDDW